MAKTAKKKSNLKLKRLNQALRTKEGMLVIGGFFVLVIIVIAALALSDEQGLTEQQDSYVQEVTADVYTKLEAGDAPGAEEELIERIDSENDTDVRRALRSSLALFYIEQDKSQQALEVYQRSESEDGYLDVGLASSLGELHKNLGNKEESAHYYTKAFELYVSQPIEEVDIEQMQYFREQAFNAQIDVDEEEEQ